MAAIGPLAKSTNDSGPIGDLGSAVLVQAIGILAQGQDDDETDGED